MAKTTTVVKGYAEEDALANVDILEEQLVEACKEQLGVSVEQEGASLMKGYRVTITVEDLDGAPAN